MVTEKRLIEVLEVLFCSAAALDIANYLIANDVVPVVRCKDCKHLHIKYFATSQFCTLSGSVVGDDEFCSSGERKDNDST